MFTIYDMTSPHLHNINVPNMLVNWVDSKSYELRSNL
jgi:hypothetical protein